MKFIKLLPIIAAIALYACGDAYKNSESANASNMDLARTLPGKGEEAGAPVPKFEEKKLIKNGEVAFQTGNLSETKASIQKALAENGGYVAKENSYDYSNNPTEELTIRVPNKNFDVFLARILIGVDKVDYKRIDIEDVTEEFVDIEARLTTKKQLEAKYKELLVKASNMEDILKIEKEINGIREEIESAEGRLKYLSNQVSYSTLTIRYYEHKASGFNFGGKLGNAIKDGSTGFLWFIIIMVQLWPLWLIGAFVWWFIRWLIKRNRRKKAVNGLK